MKTLSARSSRRAARGLTLIELTLVVLVLLALVGIFFGSSNSIRDWQKAKDASTILRQVEVAQIEFLADNPQLGPASLTAANVATYLPGFVPQPGVVPTLPTGVGLNGEVLTINVAATPPFFVFGGARYDESASNSDSLWDVGR